MDSASLKSSRSSYEDTKYRSSVSFDPPQPPARMLMDGYRDDLVPQEEKPRYNPLNPTHPRSSALLDANDPLTMFLLTEMALGDSKGYEVLSFEEVEELKKEYTFLSGSREATRRKLAAEMKLRDATQSLSRLHKPRHSRHNDDHDLDDSLRSSTGSIRPGIFGRKGESRTSEEIVSSTHKCEELAQELWNLERRTQEIQRRLLEHNAGILQMTHKGLKKNLKNQNRKPESSFASDNNGNSNDFDDRSLYRTPEHLDDLSLNGMSTNGSLALGLGSIQGMETKLEELSGRMRTMILQTSPDDNADPVPQPISDGGPVNPTSTMMAHLSYIENALDILNSHKAEKSPSLEVDNDTYQQLHELNSQLQDLRGKSGHAYTPMPPPSLVPSGDDVKEQLSYLRTGIGNIDNIIESLIEQKDILKTQIQQQRELNSKSDAERDAHIADLTEQLSHVRKQLEVAERDCQDARDNLTFVQEQLDAFEQSHESEDNAKALASEKEARQHAESELEHLQAALLEAQRGLDAHAELREIHDHTQQEVSRLESQLEQTQAEADAHAVEKASMRSQMQNEVTQFQSTIDHLRGEVDHLRGEADARAEELSRTREHADREIPRLEAALEQMRNEADAQLKDATTARTQAEENSARLQAELTELEGEIVRVQTELTMCKAELDGAYGSRAQRAAEASVNPAIQEEIDYLNTKNLELTEELAALKAGPPGNSDLQKRVEMLEKELRETIDDYEVITKASVELEKEREKFESLIDSLRDRCEQLETQLSEERINSMGTASPTSSTRDGASETTSTMVLKNEFKKMMRDTRAENMRILKAEQEERRRLEALLRTLRKEHASGK